eukprot:scaffold77280_cov34-Prasinocladus_malaysianus.AAC.1
MDFIVLVKDYNGTILDALLPLLLVRDFSSCRCIFRIPEQSYGGFKARGCGWGQGAGPGSKLPAAGYCCLSDARHYHRHSRFSNGYALMPL